MAHVHDTILINAPVDKVFAVGRDPRGWAAWTVNLSRPRRVRGDGSVGTVLTYKHLVAGHDLPLKIKVLADRFDNDGCGHWQGTLDGPIQGQQCWDYVPCDGGTQVTADVDFTVPSRISSEITDPTYIEKMEEAAIHHSLENLKFMFEH
jgi:coenzyme Q-binding protein COQ10